MKAACMGCNFDSLGQALDGGDVIAIVHRRQAETGIDALAIDQDRAGPALAVIAPLLRAGHLEMLTQEVEQRYSRIDFQSVEFAVDRQAARDYLCDRGLLADSLFSLNRAG
jgi:hypothetical protein